MKYDTSVLILAFLGLATAAPVKNAAPVYRLRGREVPQEHSHNTFLDSVRTSLNLNNPQAISDPVFGLLGDAAASAGLGKTTDPDCLQQATADQAFTNAKKAGDVAGQTAALIYRALERNTGKVGLASVSCTSVKAVNPEIAAISQHQDPASANAAATNKAIVLELAKQIASVGGNPQDALKSGTFKPGNLADGSGKGNTCDTLNDEPGCIFSQNLLVDDATAAEITAAVAGVAAAPAAASKPAAAAKPAAATKAAAAAKPAKSSKPAKSPAAVVAVAAASACPAQVTVTATVTGAAAAAATSPAAACVGKRAALDLGTCTDATIVFGPGFDGRTENSFEPANLKSFNHGSALNIGVIASFICGQLGTSCKAPAATVTACNAASQAASKLTGQAAADAFNAGIGGSAASTSTGSSACSAAAAPAASSPAASSPATVAAAPAASSPAAAAASGTNVQKFTGTLGGAAPPVVFTSGAARPFNVLGDTFLNKGAATQRSCSVQHNTCSNAANSGTLAGGQAQCETQETACNAANA